MEIIDHTNNKTLTCTECGFEVEIPPREISIEKLEQMRDNKIMAERDFGPPPSNGVRIVNLRLITCPKCGNMMLGTDRFSTVIGSIERA